jgi:hypothetical protein
MSKAAELLKEIGEAKVDAGDVIKELIESSFGGSNENQMKAVQLLKGLALSDDPRSNKFMKKLDAFTSGLKAEDFA